MNLRDQLLAHLRAPNYSPGNEYDIARKLGLGKKQRAMLAHEVRLVLKSGEFARAQNGRIAKRGVKEERPRAEARPIFQPTRRRAGAPATPPTEAPLFDAKKSGCARTPETTAASTPPASKAEPRLGEDELIGRIQFRAGGSAFVIREAGEPGEPALQVFPEDTGVALPGDRVLAREFPGRKGRRAGEKIGGVVRVLERGRTSIVGDLRRMGRDYIVAPDDPKF